MRSVQNIQGSFGILIEQPYGGTGKKANLYQQITRTFTMEYVDLFKFVSGRLRSRGVGIEEYIPAACLLTSEDIIALISAIKNRELISYVHDHRIVYGDFSMYDGVGNKGASDEDIKEVFHRSLEEELSVLIDVAKTKEIYFKFSF